MVSQINKFYISSFLKNQTFFVPILIIFLQSHMLTFQEIFWVFAIGNVISFIIEVPTGLIADLYGKRKSIIIAKFMIALSFVLFGFSSTFLTFTLSNIVLVIGKSFRSGTETAYVFDYLEQNKGTPSYTEVKGKQKFWARIGEAESSAIGGVISGVFGYQWAFFLSALLSFIGFLIALTWTKIKESDIKINLKNSLKFAKDSICVLCKDKSLVHVTINITIFAAAIAVIEKFIQPYMQQVGVPIEWFGFVYAGSLILTAFAVRNAYKFENKFGRKPIINFVSFFAVIPALIIGFGFSSLWGVLLFFVIILVQNIRSPIATTEYHNLVTNENRATMGSILELIKSSGSIILLPIAGWMTESYSIATTMLMIAGILLLNGVFFSLKKK